MPRRKKELEPGEGEKDYRFNTALARGLAILKAFGPDNRPIGNAEIAKRVGLPKATVSRLTFTLTELGYLKYDDDIGRYSLGPAILSLGQHIMSSSILLSKRHGMKSIDIVVNERAPIARNMTGAVQVRAKRSRGGARICPSEGSRAMIL